MKRPRLKPEAAQKLRAEYAIAKTVNGATPADHPSRQVSEQLTATLAELVGLGITLTHLAETLGVTIGAIQHRLARHGYRKPSPSQKDLGYLGRPTDYAARRVAECKRGHPLSGDNVRITPRGYRACRACDRIRAAQSHARRKLATSTEAA